MALFNWEQNAFQGIHTQPAKTQSGHLFAEDMQGLRIDGDGWMQLRSGITALDPDGENITGIAATPENFFVLRADGKLYIRDRNDIDTETEITGVTDLEGRISVVSFRTYVILISEGEDQGYLIDLREDKNYQNTSLGLDAPDTELYPDSLGVTLVHTVPDNAESEGEGELSEGTYIYSYAYLYYDADDDELPWNGMQSNLFAKWDNYVITDIDEEVNFARVAIAYSSDLPATHIRIYRAHINDQYNLQHVADFPIDTAGGSIVFYDGYSDNDVDSTSKERTFSTDNLIINRRTELNHRIPVEVKSIHEYNDLIWAPAGDRLVYSDLQNGNLVPWAFPEVNDIRVPGRVEFCAEINEILIFGSRDGLWRITGGTEYNFAVGQISASGPVDGYAWSKITNALAFVGEGGFFITDASSVVRASETILDDFFINKKVIRGAVAFFKDGDVLFAIAVKDDEDNVTEYQFKIEDEYWVRWNIAFQQSASVVEDNEATLVLVADNSGQLKSIDWNSDVNEDTETPWLYKSQLIDGSAAAVKNRRKRFSQFQFTGEATGDMIFKVYKENEVEPTFTKTFQSRDSLIPVKVPINRIARRLRFELTGIGPVKIQGFRLDMIL